MNNSIVDLIDTLFNNREDPWPHIVEHFSNLGFDVVNCGFFDTTTNMPTGIFSNMSQGWMAHYLDRDYINSDPFFEIAVKSNEPYVYDFDSADYDFPQAGKQAKALFRDVSEIGLKSSVIIPLNAGRGAGSGFNLGSSKRGPEFRRMLAECGDSIQVAAALANGFLTLPAASITPKKSPDWFKNRLHKDRLAPREREVLKWLSVGYRNDRIARRMNIAPVTVNFHIGSARRKLGAKTREQALAIAISEGLIEV